MYGYTMNKISIDFLAGYFDESSTKQKIMKLLQNVYENCELH